MKKKLRKGIIIGCTISAAVLVGILCSYAYFISSGNNNQKQDVSAQTGSMSLTFSDGNNGINESISFGESITKTFVIENTGSLDVKAKINWLNLTNTYLKESLTYTLSYSESEDGEYTDIIVNNNVPVSDKPEIKLLANKLIFPAGKKYYYKLIITLNYLEDVDQTTDLDAVFSSEFKLEEYVEESLETLRYLGLKLAKEETNIPNFAKPATTDETKNGLYSMKDNYGTSYYFRGAVSNNYVKFGGFYWRIIRINGDGSLRIIYDGKQAFSNGTNNSGRLALLDRKYTSSHSDAKYVGYMYGPSGTAVSTSKNQAQSNVESSVAKNELEAWYLTNIKNKNLDQYVSDTLFCNDRSIASGLGYGQSGNTNFTSVNRLLSKTRVVPSLMCSKNDAFTKDDIDFGNGILNQKVGQITGDEIALAGGTFYETNKSYYLYKGVMYWTMSPHKIVMGDAMILTMDANGKIAENFTNQSYGNLVPVINLTSEYVSTLNGNGTAANPYEAS